MLQKKYILLLFITLFTTLAQASTMSVFWHVNRFYHIEEDKPYIELAYLVPGPAFTYVDGTNEYSSMQFNIQVYQNDSLVTDIQYAKNDIKQYSETPALQNIEDLKRIEVPHGTIELIFQVSDLLDSTNYFSDYLTIEMGQKAEVSISDVLLISGGGKATEDHPFYRNGQLMTPKFLSYYPSDVRTLNFYTEFYAPNQNDSYLINYKIADERNVLVKDLANFKKVKAPFDAIYSGFDISKLPSGNYYLYIELVSKDNVLLARKRVFFQRSNQSEEIEAVRDRNELEVITNNFARKYDLRNIIHHTRALAPIADEFQKAAIEGVIKSNDLAGIQNYFFNFWRSIDPEDPEAAWLNYATDLQWVEQNFKSTLFDGYQTDRGRVYLEYGKPEDRVQRFNTIHGDFEVWYYEELMNQSQVYFVFTTRNDGNDEYFLVHSDLNGEVFSGFWAETIRNGDY